MTVCFAACLGGNVQHKHVLEFDTQHGSHENHACDHTMGSSSCVDQKACHQTHGY